RLVERGLVQQLQRAAELTGGENRVQLVRDAFRRDSDDAARAAANRGHRGIVDREVESNRQADRTEHAQRIILEIARVNHPHHAAADILFTIERIAEVAAGEVDSDGVDGEVAPPEV